MEESVTPILDQDHADPDLKEDDDSHRGKEPPALKQNPSDSTQKCSSHSPTQNKKRKLQSSDDGLGACYKKLGTLEEGVLKMTTEKNKEVDVNLSSGAIWKIVTGKCKENDLKPVLQVIYIDSRATPTIDNKQWCVVKLSDGSFWQHGCIPFEIFISEKLQRGSIVRLTKFQLTKLFRKSGIILGFNLTVIHTKCGIPLIGDPKLYPLPLVERTTPTTPDEDIEEPPTSKQNPSTSTQKCSSHSPTQNKIMAVSLTPGAISKLMTDKCTSDDFYKPLVQVIHIDSRLFRSEDNKQGYVVVLSDGSFWQIGLIADEIFISNKLQKGSIVQLTKFQLTKLLNSKDEIINKSCILVCDLKLLRTTCDIIGGPKPLPDNETPLVDRTTPTIPDEDQNHANSHHVEEPPTSKQKQDHVDSLLNEDIDDSRHHVEEPPTSIQNPSTSTQKCSSRSITQNNTDTIMGVNLTLGAITKIMTDKCSSTDLKPVVQVTNILSGRISTKNDKQCYRKFVLSDGSSSHFGCIADDIFISNKLQKGSIVQLTKFQFTKFSIYCNIRVLLINDLNVIHSKCDIIVNQESFPRNDIPLVERSTPPIPDEDHVDVIHAQESVTSSQKCSETQSRKRKHQSSSETPVLDRSKPTIMDHDHYESDTNEDVDNSHPVEEPSATTQKCSSHSLNQSKKRKRRSSNDNISKVVEDVSKMTKLTMEKIKTVDVGFKRLATLEEDVYKMTKMMEKNKEDDVGACFKKLETLEEDVSKMTRMMMEKNKEDVVGLKKLDTLEEDVYKMTKMMEKNKEDDVGACFKKLETLEEDVSKMTRMMMEKNKEVDMAYKKLETLEEDVSRMTIMMMEKNKEDVVGFKKLETLEEDVSQMTKMMEKNKEDDVGACFKKLETLEENVSKLTRMMMEKNKEDDMGACIEKLDKIGWVAQDPMYDTALLLFGQSADYRKLWLHLKPESCENWVKNAGSMFGLLD